MSSVVEVIRCPHTKLLNRFCVACGVYAFTGLQEYGVKTNRFFGTINDISLLKQIRNFVVQPQAKALKKQTVQTIQKILQNINIGLETLALGIYLFYCAFNNQKDQIANIGICLCLASKFLQHTDKKIVHVFRKYFKKVFEKEQYHEKEAYILNLMNFDINVSSFVDFLSAYMSKGACFSSQMLDVSKFQDSIIQSSKQAIFNGTFMKFPPQQLATTLLFKCRAQAKVIKVWNWHLQQCTKISAKQVNRWRTFIQSFLNQSQY